MAAIQSELIFGETGAISLTGEGFNTSGGGTLLPPPDLASMVTAVELQYISENENPSEDLANEADLKYVAVMPVDTADLVATAANSSLDYQVVSFSRYADDSVDMSDVLTFNAGNLGPDFTGGFAGVPIWPDGDGEPMPVKYDLPAFERRLRRECCYSTITTLQATTRKRLTL